MSAICYTSEDEINLLSWTSKIGFVKELESLLKLIHQLWKNPTPDQTCRQFKFLYGFWRKKMTAMFVVANHISKLVAHKHLINNNKYKIAKINDRYKKSKALGNTNTAIHTAISTTNQINVQTNEGTHVTNRPLRSNNTNIISVTKNRYIINTINNIPKGRRENHND